jgi:hypothetical protein
MRLFEGKETGDLYRVKPKPKPKNKREQKNTPIIDYIEGKEIIGANFRRDDACKHCVPPWEDCPGCPLQFNQENK